jgi:hypothetical protein
MLIRSTHGIAVYLTVTLMHLAQTTEPEIVRPPSFLCTRSTSQQKVCMWRNSEAVKISSVAGRRLVRYLQSTDSEDRCSLGDGHAVFASVVWGVGLPERTQPDPLRSALGFVFPLLSPEAQKGRAA